MSDHFEKVITLLFIGSNFKNEKVVRTEKEYEIIKDILKSSFFGKLIKFKKKFAVNRINLETIIKKNRPQIIHFSGHGIHYAGPLFEGDGDEYEHCRIDMTEDLASILNKYRDFIELVLFNVCESSNIAMRVAKNIGFTVGTSGKTDDDSAIAFTKGFYKNLLNNDNLRESVERGNNEYIIELSKKLFTSKKKKPYVLYPLEFSDSKSYAERGFLETIRREKTNIISYLIYSNPSYLGLTNYNYYLKKIRQLNLNELEKWNKIIPSDVLVKTDINEDWAGIQSINPEESVKIFSNIESIVSNPKLDRDTQYSIQKAINQYNFYLVKKTLIELIEEYENVEKLKYKKKADISDLKMFLAELKNVFQLFGFTYFNDDNSFRNKDFEVNFNEKGKNLNFSIRKIDSNEIYLSNEKSNINILKKFKEYIKNL